ncbi:peptidoglycan DD-metalloendopeptidase family protein [Bacillus sp. CRN 9]|nr:peptidoglycan DD-metalloendopeptidase family protein [Bacillus sp. CRN 9]
MLLVANSVHLPIQASEDKTKLNEEDNLIKKKISTNDSELDKIEEQINQIQANKKNINQEIEQIDTEINDADQKIMKKEEEIRIIEDDISRLKKEIKEVKERIESRNELLKERARTYQENQESNNYLNVLLGSNSFSDLISRVGAVATIIEADQSILKEHSDDLDLFDEKQKEFTSKHANLKESINGLELLSDQLEKQKKQKNKVLKSLNIEEESVVTYKMELQEEKQLLASQEKAIEKNIELKVKDDIRNNFQGQIESNVPKEQKSKDFTNPTTGNLTSDFGNRSGETHYGVDIAKAGEVPVYAAADGVVIRSYYSSSYGNVVFISHTIDGNNYTTVYAHMKNRIVNEGEITKKGQKIGFQGNTGQSFGQHLHFELHKGNWNSSKTNAINPKGFISL